jgi:hypothetical protein
MSDRLNPNEILGINGSITSQNGQFILIMQGDGNLVLYRAGTARWATDTTGQTVSQAIMQGDGNFVIYGPAGAIWDSGTVGNPGAWLILQDDGNLVIYGPAGNALWDTGTWIVRSKIQSFLPSTAAFHFSNSFPHVPLLNIDILGNQVPIGDAANGLCGGMALAARDYHESGLPIPNITSAPSSGQLFDYLVKRLLDSFNLPIGPTKYMYLMNPALSDHETWASNAGLTPRGRAWVMINEEWPKISATIDNGHLCPLGLVTIKSSDPFQMGKNHQVLAYGYELDGTVLVIWVYDPNYPNNNNITISLNISDPQHTTVVSYSGTLGGDNKIWCFFCPDYTFTSPPAI